MVLFCVFIVTWFISLLVSLTVSPPFTEVLIDGLATTKNSDDRLLSGKLDLWNEMKEDEDNAMLKWVWASYTSSPPQTPAAISTAFPCDASASVTSTRNWSFSWGSLGYFQSQTKDSVALKVVQVRVAWWEALGIGQRQHDHFALLRSPFSTEIPCCYSLGRRNWWLERRLLYDHESCAFRKAHGNEILPGICSSHEDCSQASASSTAETCDRIFCRPELSPLPIYSVILTSVFAACSSTTARQWQGVGNGARDLYAAVISSHNKLIVIFRDRGKNMVRPGAYVQMTVFLILPTLALTVPIGSRRRFSRAWIGKVAFDDVEWETTLPKIAFRKFLSS